MKETFTMAKNIESIIVLFPAAAKTRYPKICVELLCIINKDIMENRRIIIEFLFTLAISNLFDSRYNLDIIAITKLKRTT